MYGKNLSDSNTINVACTKLLSEVEPDYDPPRASPQYRRILAVSLFYKVRILKFRIIKSSTTSFYLSGHWYCESVQILFSDFHCVHCFRVCQIYSKKKKYQTHWLFMLAPWMARESQNPVLARKHPGTHTGLYVYEPPTKLTNTVMNWRLQPGRYRLHRW